MVRALKGTGKERENGNTPPCSLPPGAYAKTEGKPEKRGVHFGRSSDLFE